MAIRNTFQSATISAQYGWATFDMPVDGELVAVASPSQFTAFRISADGTDTNAITIPVYGRYWMSSRKMPIQAGMKISVQSFQANQKVTVMFAFDD